MKYYKIVIISLICFILQLSIINMIAINGISPSLILAQVLIITFLYEEEKNMIVGSIILGLLLDIAVGKYFGIYALTLFLLSIGTVLYKYYFNYESKISVIPLGILGTLFYNIIPCLILLILGEPISIIRVLMFLPISIIYNTLVMFVFYFLMIKKATARPKRSRYERYEIL